MFDSWEYPGRQGIGCNVVNSQDTENFLLFLEQLRKDPQGSRLLITAAVGIAPFVGPDGSALTDVSRFSQVLDFVSIMNYDVWGSWMPAVGPNAPLNDTCAVTQNQAGSAVSAILTWNKAGMPLNQLVLGVPAYGHSYTVRKENAFVKGSTTELAPYPAFDASLPPAGDSWSDAGGVDICGNTVKAGGTITFWGMAELGYLNSDGTTKKDITYRFDDCSQTVSLNP
jgi:chitinase